MGSGVYTESVASLIDELKRLPGIGPRTAERLASHVAGLPKDRALRLADAIRDVTRSVRPCSECANITELDPCKICADSSRDRALICVVERTRDLHAIEESGYRGVYHVLSGALAPLDGIEPRDLTVEQLLSRVRRGGVAEVILATTPSFEGEQTALYLAEVLGPMGVRLSRIARGIPVGTQLEFANRASLADALDGRREVGAAEPPRRRGGRAPNDDGRPEDGSPKESSSWS